MANAGSVHWQDMACVGRVCDPARRLIEPAYNVQSCGSVRIRPLKGSAAIFTPIDRGLAATAGRNARPPIKKKGGPFGPPWLLALFCYGAASVTGAAGSAGAFFVTNWSLPPRLPFNR